MKIPTVHLNGTSLDDLLDLHWTARSAVMQAIDAVQKAAPHGRDFYPQDRHAFLIASGEHTERLRKLESVKQDLDVIIGALTNRRP
jgi:hypothetical protein